MKENRLIQSKSKVVIVVFMHFVQSFYVNNLYLVFILRKAIWCARNFKREQ